MNNIFIRTLVFVFFFTVIFYLIISFITWNVLWFPELSNLLASDRLGILAVYLCSMFFLYALFQDVNRL